MFTLDLIKTLQITNHTSNTKSTQTRQSTWKINIFEKWTFILIIIAEPIQGGQAGNYLFRCFRCFFFRLLSDSTQASNVGEKATNDAAGKAASKTKLADAEEAASKTKAAAEEAIPLQDE